MQIELLALNKLELLAPAKNKDIGIAAIDCGADAVYIAGPAFGAREAASNTFSQIKELVSYARPFRVRVYMVLNTILFDHELKKAEEYIWEAYHSGCNAIIIQDLGILKMNLPPIDLYASTQTNIRTPEQAHFLESLGFKRLILARELSLSQIKAIRKVTSCELEAFVHGALCVSYSGQCHLSQHLAGRSANRGNCIQACRSKYDLIDNKGTVLKKDNAILSIKDFCLAGHIKELAEVGITSFKIEGRLKNATYVKNIVKYYREAIDNLNSDSSGVEFSRPSLGNSHGGFTPNPEYSFNRGYTTYFLTGKRRQWQSKESTKSIGEYIGKISKVLSNNKEGACFEYKSSKEKTVSNGDGLFLIPPSGNSFGMRADIAVGPKINTKYAPELSIGTELYRNSNLHFEKEVENNAPRRLIPVRIRFSYLNSTIEVEATTPNGINAIHHIETTDIATNSELAIKNIWNQMSKTTGIFQFEIGGIEMKKIPFVPLSTLNSIRRSLAEALFIKMNESSPRQETKPTQSRVIVTDPNDIIPPKQVTNLNCSNRLSRSLYEIIGIHPAPAYELKADQNVELMRTKYCIKFELGLCPKEKSSKKAEVNEPLFLVNQKKKFRLVFDCKNCEMVICSV